MKNQLEEFKVEKNIKPNSRKNVYRFENYNQRVIRLMCQLEIGESFVIKQRFLPTVKNYIRQIKVASNPNGWRKNPSGSYFEEQKRKYLSRRHILYGIDVTNKRLDFQLEELHNEEKYVIYNEQRYCSVKTHRRNWYNRCGEPEWLKWVDDMDLRRTTKEPKHTWCEMKTKKIPIKYTPIRIWRIK